MDLDYLVETMLYPFLAYSGSQDLRFCVCLLFPDGAHNLPSQSEKGEYD